MTPLEYFNQLIDSVSEIDGVMSVGKSGGGPLPADNESDIDIFVFCEKIPAAALRRAAAIKLGPAANEMKFSETGGRFWGVCDFITVGDIEICLMYFTTADMDSDIESALDGSRLDREDEYYYPTGRCAAFINMQILHDRNGYISEMKEKLAVYPKPLSEKLCRYHAGKINDSEDFNRAVARGDALFYHATLETALDHFLQALFAFNRCFFPSRKRSPQFIDGFKYKPANCSERLLKVIELGAIPETLRQSYVIWSELCGELLEIFGREQN